MHVAVVFPNLLVPYVWPGFIVAADDADVPRIAYSSDPERLPKGSRLLGCDGMDFPTLARQQIEPYFGNRDIPHFQREFYNRPFYIPASDSSRLTRCTFETPAGSVSRQLDWQAVEDAAFERASAEASASNLAPMGMRQVDGIWHIRIPTFSSGARDQIAALEAEIAANAEALRAAPKVVFDIRFNDGGESASAVRLASALWGPELTNEVAERIAGAQYVEFRASPANRAVYHRYATDPGATQSTRDYYAVAVRAIDAALASGQPLARVGQTHGSDNPAPLPANPVAGKVYILTQGCGSSCLDFLDLVRAIPGVTQIGLPTLADAAYTETSGVVTLPSGLSGLVYSLKVYRDRPRGHNQWHDPHIRWPGGPMTEQALSAWIRSLP